MSKLAMKGIEYDTHPVHLLNDGGQQLLSPYKEINPMKEVPSLIIDGHTLTQSLSIIEYLDETRPDPPLLPKNDPFKRAQVRKISECISSGIQAVQNLRVLKYVGAEKKMEWGHYWIDLGFKALEEILNTTSGQFCVGDEITMADLCLVPQVFNANRFKVDMSLYPTISRINDMLANLDAFKAAHPSKQPDCPDDLK